MPQADGAHFMLLCAQHQQLDRQILRLDLVLQAGLEHLRAPNGLWSQMALAFIAAAATL